ALSVEELAELAKRRPGIMSAFGDAGEFFEGASEFSFSAFEQWMRTAVLTPKSGIIEEVAGWLPSAIFKIPDSDEKRKFVREIADSLLRRLTGLRDEHLEASRGDEVAGEAETTEDSGGLLDLCFDRGLLPS